MKNNQLIKKLTVILILLTVTILGVAEVHANTVYSTQIQVYQHTGSPGQYSSRITVKLQNDGKVIEENYTYKRHSYTGEILEEHTSITDVTEGVVSMYPYDTSNSSTLSRKELVFLKNDGSKWYYHGGSTLYPIDLGGSASTKNVSSVIYLPTSAPIPSGFANRGNNIYERSAGEYTVTIYLIRYNPPTTIGNLNIQ